MAEPQQDTGAGLPRPSRLGTLPAFAWLEEHLTLPALAWFRTRLALPALEWFRERLTLPALGWFRERLTLPALARFRERVPFDRARSFADHWAPRWAKARRAGRRALRWAHGSVRGGFLWLGSHGSRWPLAAGVAFVLAGLVFAGVAWGRPHLAWTLRRSDNQLVVRLVPGNGPLASLLLSHSSVSVGRHHAGHHVAVRVPPGRTTRTTASVTSLWSTTDRLAVRVPPAPAVAGTDTTANVVTLSFSMPVRLRDHACGVVDDSAWMAALVFPRASTPCSGTLEVVARSGEEASFPVSIPALSPFQVLLPAAVSGGPAPVISFGPPGGGAFYITIDDGTYPDLAVLGLVQRSHIPITAFLVSGIAAEHLDYWKSFAAAGGDIEDHTVSHPNLASVGEIGAEMQWAGASQAFTGWFGRTPSLGRPPYGVLNDGVRVAASHAGLRYVVLWSAVMSNGQLTTYDRKPLRSGEIVILHWVPRLYDSLVRLLAAASAQGLHPAPLSGSLALAGPQGGPAGSAGGNE